MTDDNRREFRVLRRIDAVNEWIGRTICFAFVFIMVVQVMDVVLRYIFNNPTIWSWDVNGQVFSGTAILGGGYVLLRNGHVRLDLVYGQAGPRAKLVLDLISHTLMILAFAAVIWKAGEMAWSAWTSQARANTYFAPLLWPVKSTLFFGGLLLFLQAAANWVRLAVSLRAFPPEKK
ncbi:MAG: TRAP transporter small permease subunit [Thermodesulfobacteriota bacterium]